MDNQFNTNTSSKAVTDWTNKYYRDYGEYPSRLEYLVEFHEFDGHIALWFCHMVEKGWRHWADRPGYIDYRCRRPVFKGARI